MIKPSDVSFLHTLLNAPSLSAAARTLLVSQSAVSQKLARIEKRLKTHLVDRSGRSPSLTDEGKLVLQCCDGVLSQMAELNEQLASRNNTVNGELRIIAPLGFGRVHIAPIVSHFKRTYPEVEVMLTLSDRLGRHPQDGFDIMICVGQLPQTNLIRRKLAQNRRLVCASPALLAKSIRPRRPDELHDLAFIALAEDGSDGCHWRFEKDGRKESIALSPSLSSNDGEVTMGWALDGAGFIIRSEWIMHQHIRDGRLVQLIPTYALPDASVVALFTSKNYRTQRVRAFTDFIETRLSDPPWILAAAN